MQSRTRQRGSLARHFGCAIAALATIAACGSQPTGIDLQILGPASRFTVEPKKAPETPETEYTFTLNIANLSTNTEDGDVDNLSARCDFFNADAGGTTANNIFLFAKEREGTLSVAAFQTTEMLETFSYPSAPGTPQSPYLFISCTVDPKDEVKETDETNNKFDFFFTLYCFFPSSPCPGPVQNGGSLSYIPSG